MSKRQMRVRIDRYTQFCLTAVVVLLTAMVIGLWSELASPNQAQAAEPFVDASAQRKAILDAQQETNKKLDQLLELFTSGSAQVQVVEKSSARGGSDGTAHPQK